ncbi:hypothetical protein DFJ63DRAFT_311740 [Scheffersomyces coipomensis]|uniref:uncharacterized protein n=1 Tax=Scheffersomyces coipomensis TaxID=1788519 RepID=UPI00315C9C6D
MPSVSTLKSLNTQYLISLSKYPLFTKAVTAGSFAALNEILSSIITDELQEQVIFKDYKVKHFFTPKLITMIIYGSFIATPIAHYLYEIINKKLFVGKLSGIQSILKILTSLSTVTPLLAACYTSWISLINNYQFPSSCKDTSISKELSKILYIVKLGLKKGYPTVLKSSLVTSFFSLIVAQKFVPPELWVVFFNVIYFILGTYQNTKLKLLQKKQRLEQEKTESKEEESSETKEKSD